VIVDNLEYGLPNHVDPDSLSRMASRRGWGGSRPGAGRKPTLKSPKSLTLDLEGADAEALAELASERGVSVAELVRRAVKNYLRRTRRSEA
jgi:hypothetical protein